MRKATKTQVARKREIERRTPKIFGCAICGRLCGGSGHSAWPIFPDGICCDTCKENLPAPGPLDKCFKASGAEWARSGPRDQVRLAVAARVRDLCEVHFRRCRDVRLMAPALFIFISTFLCR
jgi:hypothetical protein